jgi:hypothetical protein
VIEAAFATGRERLWATFGSWNAASFRVLEKHSAGRERDETVYMVRNAPSTGPD